MVGGELGSEPGAEHPSGKGYCRSTGRWREPPRLGYFALGVKIGRYQRAAGTLSVGGIVVHTELQSLLSVQWFMQQRALVSVLAAKSTVTQISARAAATEQWRCETVLEA